MINSPLFGLYILAIFNPYANQFGSMLALVINLAINLWMSFGSIFFSRLKPQNFPPNVSECKNAYHTNMTALNLNFQSPPNSIQPISSDSFYPKDPGLAFIYSVSAIWYCMFSFLFMIIFGTLFSLIYSLITTRSLDADKDYEEERKNYLFYYRVFKFARKREDVQISHF